MYKSSISFTEDKKIQATKRRIICFATVAALTLIAAPFANMYSKDIGYLLMLAGSFALLFVIIDLRMSRLFKGITVIGYGIFFQLSYLPAFFPVASDIPGAVLDDYTFKVKLFTLMITLATSGAGGSLIAAHAEQSCVEDTDKSKKIEPQSLIIDNTEKIEKLIKETASLNKKMMFAACVSTVTLIIASMALFLVALKSN
jgi:hypothetical protein